MQLASGDLLCRSTAGDSAGAGLLGAFTNWLRALLVCATGSRLPRLFVASPPILPTRRASARIHLVALRRCPVPAQRFAHGIQQGAATGGDGRIHDLYQRKANLSASLNEYLRFG